MAATLVIGWAAFVGGDLLAQLQHLPVEESFVGRTQSILGFMVAVLAALGLQALVERQWPGSRRQWLWVAAVVGAAGVTAAYAGNRALWRARGADQVDVLRHGKALRLAASPHGQVVADAVRATDDGLRLADADDLVVYERIRAGTLAAPRQ